MCGVRGYDLEPYEDGTIEFAQLHLFDFVMATMLDSEMVRGEKKEPLLWAMTSRVRINGIDIKHEPEMVAAVVKYYATTSAESVRCALCLSATLGLHAVVDALCDAGADVNAGMAKALYVYKPKSLMNAIMPLAFPPWDAFTPLEAALSQVCLAPYVHCSAQHIPR